MTNRPRAWILASGEELVLGRTVDTNSAHLARLLGDRGFELAGFTVIGDAQPAIVSALRAACATAELVVMTGGLGPTEDDRTRQALAEVCGQPLVPSAAAWKAIVAFYRRMRRGAPPACNRQQALLPRGASLLDNDRGTAPGLLARHERTWIACLPGVPHEMRAMADRFCERLPDLFPHLRPPVVRELHAAGIGESALQEAIGELAAGTKPLVGITVSEMGHITLRVIGPARPVAGRIRALARILKPWLIPEPDLAACLVHRLARHRRTISVAESCTCGRLAARLGAIPGVSAVLHETLVTYANEAKTARLGVPSQLIERHGAVCEPVVVAMAEGLRQRTQADLTLAVSGLAGPDGGRPGKPVGTVWLAAADRTGTVTRLIHLKGERMRIQERAAAAALQLGWELTDWGADPALRPDAGWRVVDNP